MRGVRHPVSKVYMEAERKDKNRLALCQPVGLWNKILPSVTDHGRRTSAADDHGGNQFRNGFQRDNLQSDHISGSGRNRDSPELHHDTGRNQPKA